VTRGDAVIALDRAVADLVASETSVATALTVELEAWAFLWEQLAGTATSQTALDKTIKAQTVTHARAVIEARARLARARARADYWQFILENDLSAEVPDATD